MQAEIAVMMFHAGSVSQAKEAKISWDIGCKRISRPNRQAEDCTMRVGEIPGPAPHRNDMTLQLISNWVRSRCKCIPAEDVLLHQADLPLWFCNLPRSGAQT